MIYPRKLKRRIAAHLDDDLTIVVTGMRRVGKTYLLRDLFAGVASTNKAFLDLEKPEFRALFKQLNIEAIIRDLGSLGVRLREKIPDRPAEKGSRAWLFLDEVQLVRSLPSTIKYLTDHYALKVIASGSSSFSLKNLFTESLAGRKVVFRLGPLDFGEFLIFRNATNQNEFGQALADLPAADTALARARYLPLFEEYLETGGFPQAVLASGEAGRTQILRDILFSYLSVDVRTLSDFRGIDDMENLIRVLPARIGQKVDLSRLSREVGVSRPTIKQYLRFLEDTFVIATITPYSKSPDREIVAAPKLYFCDHALAAVLAPIAEGQRLENVVYTHLARLHNLNYYQRKSGPEVDYIVDKTIGVEVKSFATASDSRKLGAVAAQLGLSSWYVLSQRVDPRHHVEHMLPAFTLGLLA